MWPKDRALSGATTPGQNGPGRDDNEGVLRIPQSSSITGTSPSDCLMSYIWTLVAGDVLPPCRDAVCKFYRSSQLGWIYCYALSCNYLYKMDYTGKKIIMHLI